MIFWWTRLSCVFLLEFRMPQNGNKQKKTTRFTRTFPTKNLQVCTKPNTQTPPCRLLLELCHGLSSHIGLGSGSPRVVPRKKNLRMQRAKGAGFWLPWTKVRGEFEDDFFKDQALIKSPGCFFSVNPKKLFTNFLMGYFRSWFCWLTSSCKAGATSAALYPRQSMVNHFRLDRPREVFRDRELHLESRKLKV